MSSVSSVAQRDAGSASYGPTGRSPWLDVDWGQHQRWSTTDGSPLNFIEIGTGRPLLFIHGLSGSWPNWLEQLPVFARAHRVIAVDLPGFGHSPMPRERISISGYARTLDALLETLDIDAAAVVGNSMGGFVAAELAIAFPQRASAPTTTRPPSAPSQRCDARSA